MNIVFFTLENLETKNWSLNSRWTKNAYDKIPQLVTPYRIRKEKKKSSCETRGFFSCRAGAKLRKCAERCRRNEKSIVDRSGARVYTWREKKKLFASVSVTPTRHYIILFFSFFTLLMFPELDTETWLIFKIM